MHIAGSLGRAVAAVEFPSRYGGNIRVTIGKDGKASGASRLDDTLQREAGFFDEFAAMRSFVASWTREKRAEIQELVDESGPLPAKAFPGRAAILVALLGLSENGARVRLREAGLAQGRQLRSRHPHPHPLGRGAVRPLREHRHDREPGLAHPGRDRVLSQESRLPGPDRADCLKGLTTGSSSAAAAGRGSWPPSCAPCCPRIARSTSKRAGAMPGCWSGGTRAPTRSASRSSSNRSPARVDDGRRPDRQLRPRAPRFRRERPRRRLSRGLREAADVLAARQSPAAGSRGGARPEALLHEHVPVRGLPARIEAGLAA